jgi:hypothetical protein
MKTYVALCRFTEQGIRSVKDTTRRADAVKEAAGKFGATMQIYWTSGRFDLLAIIDASGRGVCQRLCPEHRHRWQYPNRDAARVYKRRNERHPGQDDLNCTGRPSTTCFMH